MSTEIPFHIQEQIIKKLPVVSLLRFRSVSKAWTSLIDSSEFIAAHSVTDQPHHLLVKYSQPPRLLVKYWHPAETAGKYVSFADDDAFPQQRFVHSLPLSVKLLNNSSIVGSSYGVFCFRGYYDYYPNLETEAVVLWNPTIRKSVTVSVPSKTSPDQEVYLGFGVCPVTIDPKIVAITQSSKTSYHCEASVYNVRLGKWRSLSSNLPSKAFPILSHQVVVGRFIYWCALDRITRDNGLPDHNLIMSFDTTNENFGEIELPDNLRHHPPTKLSVSKLKESLVMLEYDSVVGHVRAVWMMESGAQNLFTRLFTVQSLYLPSTITTLGFRKSGQPIIQLKERRGFGFEQSGIMVSGPNPKRFIDLETYGKGALFVKSYMETLVLLGLSDCSSY